MDPLILRERSLPEKTGHEVDSLRGGLEHKEEEKESERRSLLNFDFVVKADPSFI